MESILWSDALFLRGSFTSGLCRICSARLGLLDLGPEKVGLIKIPNFTAFFLE